MGGLVLLLVLFAGLVTADRKLTIYERLREDADLSQVFKTFGQLSRLCFLRLIFDPSS